MPPLLRGHANRVLCPTLRYKGVKDLTLNVAATELLGTPKATLQCKYSMGKSSVTLSATSAKTLGLSLEIA